MPVNRNALIRFRTINTCLRNRQRRWTLNDLIEACSEALYEYEGIDKGVSKRTIQADLQIMRSDKLGYNAPIVVLEKKYYTYSDPEYSITENPLTGQDLNTLNEVVQVLGQFKGFSHFEDLDEIIKRLQDKVYISDNIHKSIIDFEKNEALKGLHHLDDLYNAIQQRYALIISYKSFNARQSSVFQFHPQFLKEYRNRWFVVGIKQVNSHPLNLALDRIEHIEHTKSVALLDLKLSAEEYYHDVVGVTVSPNMKPRTVRLFVDRSNAPYVLTKPLHRSQKLEKKVEGGIIITIKVQLNFELEREILGFGDSMKVLSPSVLVTRINKKLRLAVRNYDNPDYPVE